MSRESQPLDRANLSSPQNPASDVLPPSSCASATTKPVNSSKILKHSSDLTSRIADQNENIESNASFNISASENSLVSLNLRAENDRLASLNSVRLSSSNKNARNDCQVDSNVVAPIRNSNSVPNNGYPSVTQHHSGDDYQYAYQQNSVRLTGLLHSHNETASEPEMSSDAFSNVSTAPFKPSNCDSKRSSNINEVAATSSQLPKTKSVSHLEHVDLNSNLQDPQTHMATVSNMSASPGSFHHRTRGYTDSIASMNTSSFNSANQSLVSGLGDSTGNLRSVSNQSDVVTPKVSNDSQSGYPTGSACGPDIMQKSISDTKLDSANERDMSSDGMVGNYLNSSTPHFKGTNSKPSKKESLRQQKKFYRQEKKKFAQEIMSTLNDPSIEMIANFLKVRTTLKTWVRLYCVLKPGLLVLYRSQKTSKGSQWVGTVLLSSCQLMERPSKKDGFCFKLFHPLEQSIWALRGPHGESTSLMGLNLPSCYLIFRALSDSDGKCWMDHLELTMKIAPSRLKNSINDTALNESQLASTAFEDQEDDFDHDPDVLDNRHFPVDESDVFSPLDHYPEEVMESENDEFSNRLHRDSSSTVDPNDPGGGTAPNSPRAEAMEETKYVPAPPEVMGDCEGAGQEESVQGENKSLILTLVKQVKPGMDLSKVVLPTFILEPRSFLDKLSDYYYHSDMVASAITQDDPFERMKSIVIFYLSGFYKKPKGLKKPYNPILGEYFRCYWQHPSGSKTFYIAEQVSHHPPISTFHVTNREEGFAISGTILAKSRFYGTSVSALFDGCAKITLLTKGEDYEITFPYAFCKGILFGTLSMELGGKVHISCEKTGYHTDIEFKLKPYLFGGSTNAIIGHISLGGKKLATIDGKWDGEIFLTDSRGPSPERSKIWSVTNEVKTKRLPRYIVDYSSQNEFESERLWNKVEKAIITGDQKLATEEKFVLEERQRKEAKERLSTGQQWKTRYFDIDPVDPRQYVYKYSDYRPWDKDNDLKQFEKDGVIRTLTKHKIAPLTRCGSAHNVPTSRLPSVGNFQNSLDTPVEADEDETSAEERWPDSISDSAAGNEAISAKKASLVNARSQSRNSTSVSRVPVASGVDVSSIEATKRMTEMMEENSRVLRMLQHELNVSRQERNRANSIINFIITVAIAVLVQFVFHRFSHLVFRQQQKDDT